MERYALIDEFAVIDSGSRDKTLQVAGNYGADVYLASDILPEVGDKRGKEKPLEGHPPTERSYLLRGCRHIDIHRFVWFGRSAHQAGRGSLREGFL